MSSKQLLIFVLPCILGLVACVAKTQGMVPFNTCVAGEVCTLKGKLELHAGQPAWAALLVSGKECAKLALPDDFYSDARLWDQSEVSVTGRAFKQPADNEKSGIATLWYTEKERKLAMGMCDGGIGLYVDTVRSGDGRSWSSPPLSIGP